jgi:hypothetical protein
MQKIDEDLIARGKALNNLKEDVGFAALTVELNDRIKHHRDHLLGEYGTSMPDIIYYNFSAHMALSSLKQWIYDEIESAGKEIIKKQQAGEDK